MRNHLFGKTTKTIMAAILGIALLAGCASSGGGSVSGNTDASGDTVVQTDENTSAETAEGTDASSAEAERAGTDDVTAGTETEHDLLAEIEERGTIIVAMEGTWAPWTYHDESDNLVGYDVEVAEKIAAKLGVEAEFIEGEWDGLLAGLEAGRYDIMVNGVDVTPERSEKYDFSTPYAFNRTAVITRADDDSVDSMEDLNGKHTANTISSTYAEVAEKYGAEVTGVDDLNQTMELLLSGRIDATLNAEVTFYDYLNAHPDANIKIAAIDPEETSVAIPMRKGTESERLLEAINEALSELSSSGELSALSEKYFGTDISGTGQTDSSGNAQDAERAETTNEREDELQRGTADDDTPQTDVTQMDMVMKIGDTSVAVAWEDNESVNALKTLAVDDPLAIQMSKYGGFEQVGSIGQTLPREDVQTTTTAGDIVLYSGNQIVVFFGSNSWAYTRLGHITDKSAAELAELLGNGDVTIALSLQ